MPLHKYGVLAGRAVEKRREGSPDESPHYQIHVTDADELSYRVAVNVQSQESPSELLYLVNEDFDHPIIASMPDATSGWTALAAGPGGANLDFIRGNLFDRAAMRLLPPDVTGPDNDLEDLLDHSVDRAIEDPQARIYVFGERWGPENGKADKVFGFRPGNGVHNIHMNQGNSAQFRRDDGVWQDGGLLIHFPGRSRWVAIFLAFQSQAWHTDDVTGHRLERAQDQRGEGAVRVAAALVNSAGGEPEAETVTLINAAPDPVDLTGWRIADRLKHTCPILDRTLAAGETSVVGMTDGVQLGNSGGAITLLDHEGLKVDGVSYTADQARREGWTLVF
jgi:uncharacterized protein YukJ